MLLQLFVMCATDASPAAQQFLKSRVPFVPQLLTICRRELYNALSKGDANERSRPASLHLCLET